ncbi:MAG TPA: bifunctional DNA primase/polymerase [Candidatus Binatia bacterium]|nr:bifunctional DNA primase/polymerase [Candidatus Binatia bacterium]
MGTIALTYAEFGWPVFPVHTPSGYTDRPCSCRRVTCPQLGKHPCHKNTCKGRGKHPCHQFVCASVGKHPRTKNGVHDASTDEAKIRRWWETWENANIGVATGKEAGIFALDVDPCRGGDEALASLEAKYGKLPETRTADTGGGGVHYLFKYPKYPVKNSTGVLGPGLDVKGEGGAIVVTPSLHMSGNRYRWRNDAPIADAPEWFLWMLWETQKLRANGSATIGVAIPEGMRNDTLTSLAGTMRRRGMEAEEIEAALFVTNNKRCDPPLAEDEVRKIASSVCRYKPAGEAAFR